MSSWFDAKNLTSFAKTALNEAQKTLDKALDIQEEEEQLRQQNAKATNNTNTSISSPASPTSTCPGEKETSTLPSSVDEPPSSSKMTSSASTGAMWGSFTGSYFQVNDVGGTSSTKGPASVEEDKQSALENIEDNEEEDTINSGKKCQTL